MAGVGEAAAQARAGTELLSVRDSLQQGVGPLSVGLHVERPVYPPAGTPRLSHSPFGLRLLDVGRVQQHDGGQIRSGGGGEYGPLETLFHQSRYES